MVISNFSARGAICFLISILMITALGTAKVYTFIENAESYCNTVSTGPNSVTIDLSIQEISLDSRVVNGTEYLCPILSGYRNNLQVGAPAVLVNYFSMITGPNPNLDITILEQESHVIDNVLLYPSQPAPAITPDHQNELAPFTKDNSLYASKTPYPSAIAGVHNKMEYRGKYMTAIWLSPMFYNAATKQLRVYTKLKAKITNREPVSQVITDRRSALSLLKNNTVNAKYLIDTKGTSEIDDDDADDVIIITDASYKEAAEKLAIWQRQKGYDVKVVSKSAWSSSNVASEVKNFYENTTPKPAHMLIFGDKGDVPSSSGTSKTSDLYYVCFGGSGDYVADMGRGRISVSSANKAMGVVDKILKYEKEPPETEHFYKTVLSAAQFQTNSSSTDTERWAFTYCCETSARHLKEKYGYDLIRVYNAQNNGSPKYWDPRYVGYESGNQKKRVPEDIQKPNYHWKGGESDNVEAINKGVFMAFHYDHGSTSGWVTPRLYSSSMDKLKNGNMLPVMYSINCSSGSFQSSCFAEAALNKADGGAIGVIAATAVTYAGGANDALVMGLVDASFPRNLYEPKQTVNASERDTTYILGEIFNHGLIRHGECAKNQFKLHSEIYHLFGDPTTDIWTAKPKDITATHKEEVTFSDDKFDVSGLNVPRGMASLLNNKTGMLAGKKLITGPSVSIPISKFTEEGKATLTVTSHNYKPYIVEIAINEQSGIHNSLLAGQKRILIRMGNRSIASVNSAANSNINIALYNVKGQVVYQHSDKIPANSVIELPENRGIGNGIYMLKVTVDSRSLMSNVIFHN